MGYLIKLASDGLSSVINDPTKVTITSSTCIDHVYVRFTARECVSKVTDTDETDGRIYVSCAKGDCIGKCAKFQDIERKFD